MEEILITPNQRKAQECYNKDVQLVSKKIKYAKKTECLTVGANRKDCAVTLCCHQTWVGCLLFLEQANEQLLWPHISMLAMTLLEDYILQKPSPPPSPSMSPHDTLYLSNLTPIPQLPILAYLPPH